MTFEVTLNKYFKIKLLYEQTEGFSLTRLGINNANWAPLQAVTAATAASKYSSEGVL